MLYHIKYSRLFLSSCSLYMRYYFLPASFRRLLFEGCVMLCCLNFVIFFFPPYISSLFLLPFINCLVLVVILNIIQSAGCWFIVSNDIIFFLVPFLLLEHNDAGRRESERAGTRKNLLVFRRKHLTIFSQRLSVVMYR